MTGDDVSHWYWKYGPFTVKPVTQARSKESGYTHKVVGPTDVGGLFRSEDDAHRVAASWNLKAALYCMVGMR